MELLSGPATSSECIFIGHLLCARCWLKQSHCQPQKCFVQIRKGGPLWQIQPVYTVLASRRLFVVKRKECPMFSGRSPCWAHASAGKWVALGPEDLPHPGSLLHLYFHQAQHPQSHAFLLDKCALLKGFSFISSFRHGKISFLLWNDANSRWQLFVLSLFVNCS